MTLHGLSSLGPHFRVFIRTVDGMVRPGRMVPPNQELTYDTDPQHLWDFDVSTQRGYDELRRVAGVAMRCREEREELQRARPN